MSHIFGTNTFHVVLKSSNFSSVISMKNKKFNSNSLTDFMKDIKAYLVQFLTIQQTKSFSMKNKEKTFNWMRMMWDKYCAIFIQKVKKLKLCKWYLLKSLEIT